MNEVFWTVSSPNTTIRMVTTNRHITHPVKEDVKNRVSPLPSEGAVACIQLQPASPP
jgi:hypothetical protein